MPDDTAAERLLAKFEIDIAPIKKAFTEIQDLVNKANQALGASTQQTAGATQHLRQQLDQIKVAQEQLISAARVSIEQEKLKIQAAKTSVVEIQKQAQEQQAAAKLARIASEEEIKKKIAAAEVVGELKKETAELEKQRKEHQANLASIQAQMAEIRKRRLEEQHEGRAPGGHPGGWGGLRYGIGRAIFGEGIAGAVTAGIIAGGGVSLMLESFAHAAEKFVEKIKEATVEAGNFVKVQDTFEKLARGRGESSVVIMQKLREATEGEVDDLTLMRTAMTSLQSSSRLTTEELEKGTRAVFRLAEAHGKEGVQGLQAFNRVLLTGNVRSLARLNIGLDQAILKVGQLPPTMGRVERMATQIRAVIKAAEEEEAKLGVTPDTLEDVEKRMRAARRTLMQRFGAGFNESVGTGVFIEVLNNWAKQLRDLGPQVQEFGKRLGFALATATPLVELLRDAFMKLLRTIGDVVEVVGRLFGMHLNSDFASGLMFIGNVFLTIKMIAMAALTAISTLVKSVGALGRVMYDIAAVPTFLAMGQVANARKASMDILKIGQDLKKAWYDDFKEFGEKTAKDWQDWGETVGKLMVVPATPRGGIPPPKSTDEETLREKMRMAQLERQLEHDRAKAELEDRKAAIEEAKTADRNAYKEGEETLEQHLEIQRSLIQKGHEARLEEIVKGYNADLDMLGVQLRLQMIKRKEHDIRVLDAFEKYRRSLTLEHERTEKELTANVEEGIRDRIAAKIKEIEGRAKLDQRGIQDEERVTDRRKRLLLEEINTARELAEKRFSGGKLGPQEYLQTQLDSIAKARDTEVSSINNTAALKRMTAYREKQEAEDLLRVQVKNTREQEAAREKLAEVNRKIHTIDVEEEDQLHSLTAKNIRELENLYESLGQKVLQSIERPYHLQQQFLETQIQYQQSIAGQTFAQPTEDLLKRLLQNLEQQRKELIDLANSPAVEKYSDTWYQIVDRVERAYQTQLRYNEELKKMQDILRPALDLFGQLGRSIGEVFGQKFAQNLSETIGRAVQYAQGVGQLTDVIFGRGGVKKDPRIEALENEAAAATISIKSVTSPMPALRSELDKLITKLQEFRGTLQGVVEQADRLQEGPGVQEDEELESIRAVSGQRRPRKSQTLFENIAGIFGKGGNDNPFKSGREAIGAFITQISAAVGAIGGFIASITTAKSAVTGGIGGAISGAGLGMQLGGPWGAAIGAVGGGIAGAIVGGKQARVQRDITELTNRFKDIMNQFDQNTNNLNLAIIRMQDLAQQAREMQSRSKKGHEDYQKQIDQYNDQIRQMEIQRMQIIRDMDQQLAKLRAPYGMQEYLGTLQEIIQQYDKFAGAARNAEELANANELLVRSLRDYEYELQQKMATDEQGAINDALQLNDLLYQRQQLVRQLSDQIAGVMSQGVLTRQLTMAQTKGAQVYEIQVNAQRQLEQMNEQIAAANYRVSLESKIFGLAQTRIGLEMQLLVLQNRQTDWDMERILALRQFYSELSSGKISSSMAGLLGAIPITSNPIGLIDLARFFEMLAAGAYQDRATMGYAGFRGANLR